MFEGKIPFNVGDRVVCINPGPPGNHLIKGAMYIVRIITDDGFVGVEGTDNLVFHHRFKAAPILPFHDEMTYKFLYQQARLGNIPNRSKMNKLQLVEALNKVQPIVAKAIKEAAIMPVAEPPLGEQLRDKVAKDKQGYGICSFAYKLANQKDPIFQLDAVCHAALNYTESGIETLVEDIGRHVNKHPFLDAYKEYLDYLINRSPYREGFITKNVDEAIKGGLYLNTSLLHSRVVACIVASREGSEFPGRVDEFKKLKDSGISENVAWIMANFLTNSGRYVINALSNGHSVFNHAMSYDDVCKFFREGFHTPLRDKPCNGGPHQQYTIHKSIAKMPDYMHGDDQGKSVYEAICAVMKHSAPQRFGDVAKKYTLEGLKPLIEKLEKDFQ